MTEYSDSSGPVDRPAHEGASSGGASDADVGALAAEDRLPARHEPDTVGSDDPEDGYDDYQAAGYDGDLAALTAEDRLPARHEPDTVGSGDPEDDYDEAPGAFAAEDRLPGRHEPDAGTRGDAPGYDEAGVGAGYDGDLDALTAEGRPLDTSADSTSASQSDTAAEPPSRDDEDGDSLPGLTRDQVAGHTQDGADVPVSVEYLPPEARTVGDTTPTGIGRKPTGAEILDMEGGDRTDSRLDRIFDEMVKRADDVADGSGAVGEAIVIDDSPAPGPSGHSRPYHATASTAPDSPVPPNPGANDAISSMTIIGVAAAVALRYALSALRKEHKA